MTRPTKTDLLTLDFGHAGAPFVRVAAYSGDTDSLDVGNAGAPFFAAPSGGAHTVGPIGIASRAAVADPLAYGAGLPVLIVEDFEDDVFAIPFTTVAGNPWARTTTSPYAGSYAFQSGVTGDVAASIVEATLTVFDAYRGGFSLRYRTDSEVSDRLTIRIDGNVVKQVGGTVGAWTFFGIVGLAPGAHTLQLEYAKDGSSAQGADAVYIDELRFFQASDTWLAPYAEDFDTYAPRLPFSADASGRYWELTETFADVGAVALRSSSRTGDGQATETSFVVTTPAGGNGALSLRYRPDSESTHDALTIYVDDVLKLTASGQPGVFSTLTVPDLVPGAHTVRLRYAKDSSAAWGTDAAYIDSIAFDPGIAAGASVAPSGIAAASALGAATLSQEAAGDPQSVSPSGIGTLAALGAPALAAPPNQAVTAAGIATVAALGDPALELFASVEPSAIASGAAFGAASLGMSIEASGLGPALALGVPLVVHAGEDQPLTIPSIAPTSALGSATLALGPEPGEAPDTTGLEYGWRGAPFVESAPADLAVDVAYAGRPFIAAAEAAPAGPADQAFVPAAIAPAVAVGTPTLEGGDNTQALSASAIAPAVAFGVPRFDQSIVATGLPSSAAVGTPRPLMGLLPSAIAPVQALGVPRLDQRVAVPAIASREAFGVVRTGLALVPASIAPAPTVGTPSLGFTVQPSAIGAAATLGAPRLDLHLAATARASSAAVGAPRLDMALAPQAIAPRVECGVPAIDLALAPTSIASIAACGAPRLDLHLRPLGWTASRVGQPKVVPKDTASPDSIENVQAFGVPVVGLGVHPLGIAPLAAVGRPRLIGGELNRASSLRAALGIRPAVMATPDLAPILVASLAARSAAVGAPSLRPLN